MEEKRNVNRLIDIIHKLCNVAGYKIVGRVVLENRKTGTRWE